MLVTLTSSAVPLPKSCKQDFDKLRINHSELVHDNDATVYLSVNRTGHKAIRVVAEVLTIEKNAQ